MEEGEEEKRRARGEGGISCPIMKTFVYSLALDGVKWTQNQREEENSNK